jgi:periplasmic divalent cation tolerance protein
MSAPVALVVLCTCPDEAVADRIVSALLERRLAACINRVRGVESIYRWEGKIERDTEQLLIIKTGHAAYSALEACIQEVHPYDVPEVIALSVERGSHRYLDWIAESVD